MGYSSRTSSFNDHFHDSKYLSGWKKYQRSDVFDRLDDLKGVDQLKIELKEIVYCASDPKGFIQLGGKFPQSVLLVGLPGSGKKMSARAIAREAGVHFFPCNARVLQESEYDAEWVKDMFKDAKRSPCVVFIDEIDAIGQNPKDQSLKQVIDELNGIRENEKIIVIGATNNPNALDMSLLRHGLFDRRIIIPYPDIDGRRKILESHLSKTFGRTPLTNISPKKTWEGTIIGFCGCIVTSVVLSKVFSWPLSSLSAIALGILTFFGSVFGDLTESMIKRDAGVKDSGSLIPGGVLDRADSYVFTGALAYSFVKPFLPLYGV